MDNDDIFYLDRVRMRSKRRRKRTSRYDADKQLLAIHREERALYKQIWNLGWTELKPPVQQGYERFFVLRGDVHRTKEAKFFDGILQKINTRHWSPRKDFKKKQRRFGKKVYAVRGQSLRDVDEREFLSHKFSDDERVYFYPTLTHIRQCKKPILVYRFSEPWRFVLKISANMITKVRLRDETSNSDLRRLMSI